MSIPTLASWSLTEVRRRLANLDAARRLAVAAGCTARVLPLFESMTEEGVRGLAAAVALAWRVAEGGTAGASELRDARDALEDMNADDDGEYSSPARVAATVRRAVRALLDVVPGADGTRAGDCLFDAHEAVVHFVRYEDGRDVSVDTWPAEEEAWQAALLALAEGGASASALRIHAEAPASWWRWLEDEWGWERRRSDHA